MNFKKLWGGTVAAAVMLSSSFLLTQSNSHAEISSVKNAQSPECRLDVYDMILLREIVAETL